MDATMPSSRAARARRADTMPPATRLLFCSIGAALLLATSGCQRTPPAASSASTGAAAATSAADAGDPDHPNFGGDFTLTNQDGQPFHLADLRGRPVFLFFGYTSCPDMCPTTMARIGKARDRLGDRAAQVATVFVSLDPKRDTPAVLKAYVKNFATPPIALTGTNDEIARVAAAYHVSYHIVQPDSPAYLINHTTAIFLVDPQGRLRQYFGYDEDPDRLAAAVQSVMTGSDTRGRTGN
jgi:protein SCO1/2